MPLVVSLPFVAWLLIVLLDLPVDPLLALAQPWAVYSGLAMVAALAALMRQWGWWYWVALSGSLFYVVSSTLNESLSSNALVGLQFFLPLWVTVLALSLSALRKPSLWTLPGLIWLLTVALTPWLLFLAPLESLYLWLALPPSLHQPLTDSVPFSTLLSLVLAALALIWFVLIVRHRGRPQLWGEYCCWLLAMGFLATLQYPAYAHLALMAASLGMLLALALQMLNLAYIDELTQLPQRRALLSHLRRLNRRGAVTMLDVDHFKKFNDTYGHDVGDQVLKLLGSIFAKAQGFKAYRYGGEEFTFVFSHSDPARIEAALEDVRKQVANYPLQLRSAQRPKKAKQGQVKRGGQSGGKRVRVTISLGCALRRPGESSSELIKRADSILYSAKKGGRNRTLVKA
ncbi:diguanylate cyclase [Aliidiomarina sp. Khilg15.8]